MSDGALYAARRASPPVAIRAALEARARRARPGAQSTTDAGPARYWPRRANAREVGIISAMTRALLRRLQPAAPDRDRRSARVPRPRRRDRPPRRRAGGWSDDDLVRAIAGAVTGKRPVTCSADGAAREAHDRHRRLRPRSSAQRVRAIVVRNGPVMDTGCHGWDARQDHMREPRPCKTAP